MIFTADQLTATDDGYWAVIDGQFCVDEGHPDGYACPDGCPGIFPPAAIVALDKACYHPFHRHNPQTADPCEDSTCRWKHRWYNDASHCPTDCIDGRHTFTIEVNYICDHRTIERDTQWQDHERRCIPHTYRVSIVPDTLLPIMDDQPGRHYSQPFIWLDAHGACRSNGDPIALPPTAKPGQFAVQLKATP